MWALFVGVFVLSIASVCLAQVDREAQPIPDSGTLFRATPSAPQALLRIDPLPLIPDQPGRGSNEVAKMRAEGILRPDGGCFTMRTYQFSRGSVGSAPRMTGYTTCVPSQNLELRQAGPRAKFVPQ